MCAYSFRFHPRKGRDENIQADAFSLELAAALIFQLLLRLTHRVNSASNKTVGTWGKSAALPTGLREQLLSNQMREPLLLIFQAGGLQHCDSSSAAGLHASVYRGMRTVTEPFGLQCMLMH